MTDYSFYSKYLAQKENFANLCLILGSQNLIFTSAMLFISTLFFFLKLSLSFLVIIIALTVSMTWGWWASKKYFSEDEPKLGKIFILMLFLFYIILYSCMAISGSFLDLSCDGQSYHQGAVIPLMDGWNPVYNDVPNIPRYSPNWVRLDNDWYPNTLWINHYPKGTEINAAILSKITDNIEKGKALNLFLIITTFLIATATIILTSDFTKLKSALFLGFLISMNPVSICQSITYEVDGQLASAITCLLCLILLLSKRVDIIVLVSLISTIIVLINIKFTGLIYALILSLGLLAWIFIYQKEKLVLISKCLFLGLLIGSLFVGYNPYVKNTIEHGNPFYPIVGSDVDIMKVNRPDGFEHMNPLERLFVSIFSHPSKGVNIGYINNNEC